MRRFFRRRPYAHRAAGWLAHAAPNGPRPCEVVVSVGGRLVRACYLDTTGLLVEDLGPDEPSRRRRTP